MISGNRTLPQRLENFPFCDTRSPFDENRRRLFPKRLLPPHVLQKKSQQQHSWSGPRLEVMQTENWFLTSNAAGGTA
jgi:hypothetical protein